MNFTKQYLWVFFLFFLIFSLFGCGEKPENQDPVQSVQITSPPAETETAVKEAQPIFPLEPGPRVYVDGTEILATGSDGATSFVSAVELLTTLGNGAPTLDRDTGKICLNGVKIPLSAAPILFGEALYVPLRDICEAVGVSVLWDGEENTVYCTSLPAPSIPEGHSVPVLMYHALGDDPWGIESLFVRPEDFEKHLIYLTENGYDPIFFEDLCHVDEYDKPVILTFDDGYADNYTALYPLLQKYGVKATIFLATGFINRDPNYLTTQQIREMTASNLIRFQSHTVTHPYLDTLTAEEQRLELEQSRLEVARLTLREPFVLAYPSGRYNDDTLSIAEDCYRIALRSVGGLYTTGSNSLLIPRFFIGRDTSMEVFRYYIK